MDGLSCSFLCWVFFWRRLKRTHCVSANSLLTPTGIAQLHFFSPWPCTLSLPCNLTGGVGWGQGVAGAEKKGRAVWACVHSDGWFRLRPQGVASSTLGCPGLRLSRRDLSPSTAVALGEVSTRACFCSLYTTCVCSPAREVNGRLGSPSGVCQEGLPIALRWLLEYLWDVGFIADLGRACSPSQSLNASGLSSQNSGAPGGAFPNLRHEPPSGAAGPAERPFPAGPRGPVLGRLRTPRACLTSGKGRACALLLTPDFHFSPRSSCVPPPPPFLPALLPPSSSSS